MSDTTTTGGINRERYHSPAIRSDAGTIAIQTSSALNHIAAALEGLQRGEDIAKHITVIKDCAAKLESHWDWLAGWTDIEG